MDFITIIDHQHGSPFPEKKVEVLQHAVIPKWVLSDGKCAVCRRKFSEDDEKESKDPNMVAAKTHDGVIFIHRHHLF